MLLYFEFIFGNLFFIIIITKRCFVIKLYLKIKMIEFLLIFKKNQIITH